jgi:hypothetical protein
MFDVVPYKGYLIISSCGHFEVWSGDRKIFSGPSFGVEKIKEMIDDRLEFDYDCYCYEELPSEIKEFISERLFIEWDNLGPICSEGDVKEIATYIFNLYNKK